MYEWDELVELLNSGEFETIYLSYHKEGKTTTSLVECNCESDIWDARDKGYDYTGRYLTVRKTVMTQYGQTVGK